MSFARISQAGNATVPSLTAKGRQSVAAHGSREERSGNIHHKDRLPFEEIIAGTECGQTRPSGLERRQITSKILSKLKVLLISNSSVPRMLSIAKAFCFQKVLGFQESLLRIQQQTPTRTPRPGPLEAGPRDRGEPRGAERVMPWASQEKAQGLTHLTRPGQSQGLGLPACRAVQSRNQPSPRSG